MDKDDFLAILRVAIPAVIIVAVAIIIVSFLITHENTSVPEGDTSITVDYQNDTDYMGELDALAMSLSLDSGVLERSFNTMYTYVGGILQSENNNRNNNALKFETATLEKLLNQLDFWETDEETYATKEEYLNDMEEIKNLTGEDINDVEGKDFVSGYERYIITEMLENRPTIKERFFYNNKVIYLIESSTHRTVVTFDIRENSYIYGYEVIQ